MQHSTLIHYGPDTPLGEMDFLIPQLERFRGEDVGFKPQVQADMVGTITREAWLENSVVQDMIGAEGAGFLRTRIANGHKSNPDFMQSAVEESYRNITDARRWGAVIIAGVPSHGQIPSTGQELQDDILVFPRHRVVGFSNVSLKYPQAGVSHTGFLGSLRRSFPPGSYNSLTHVNVLPEYQGKNIGAALMFLALSEQSDDLPSVTHVLEADAGLIDSLGSLGYSVDARLTNVPTFGLLRPVDFVRLRAESTGEVRTNLVERYPWLQNAVVTTDTEMRFKS
jgi:ribosomal protein S18 acetylase RimI-like enzyme